MSGKLQSNNIYTIAKRNVEGQDMLYQSLKLTNGIWILAELRIQPGNPNYTVRELPQRLSLSNRGISCFLTFPFALDQGSPTFLNLRATSWVLSHTKGTPFDTLF